MTDYAQGYRDGAEAMREQASEVLRSAAARAGKECRRHDLPRQEKHDWQTSAIVHGEAARAVEKCALPTAPDQSEAEGLREALEPFARFLDAAELLSGPSRLEKDEDPVYRIESGKVGVREITYGDLKRARAALARHRKEGR